MDSDRDTIAFILDNPEFYSLISQHLDISDFEDELCASIYSFIKKIYIKYQSVPTREILQKIVGKKLRTDVDMDEIENIYNIINHKIHPRDVSIIRDDIKEYIKRKLYNKIYSEEYMQYHIDGEYTQIDEVVEEARKLDYTDVVYDEFFEIVDDLFIPENIEHLTSGFPDLDVYLHDGGPTRGEILCWLAPTGKGKSLVMSNCGVVLIRRGFDVLHISLEMHNRDNATRYLGIFTELNLAKRYEDQETFKELINRDKERSGRGDLILTQYPADAINVDTIDSLLHSLALNRNWKPDVIIVDYLELMLSRVPNYNRTGNDYTKQKAIATELHGLATKENVMIITANQTNRSGYSGLNDDAKIGLGQQAESFGKAMPMEYVISINQSKEQYESQPPVAEFYIAKNRNGPTGKTITVRIDYSSYKVKSQRLRN